MINNFSDVVQFKINIVFVAYVSGVEHLKRSAEHDLVIVMDNWKEDYKDIYCKSLSCLSNIKNQYISNCFEPQKPTQILFIMNKSLATHIIGGFLSKQRKIYTLCRKKILYALLSRQRKWSIDDLCRAQSRPNSIKLWWVYFIGYTGRSGQIWFHSSWCTWC